MIFLTVLVATLLPILKHTGWGYARSEVVQATSQMAVRLVTDLQAAPFEAITLPTAAEPGVVGIHPIAEVTDTGVAVWDKQLVLYYWSESDHSLTRRTLATDSTAAPLLLAPAQVRAAFDRPDSSRRCLAKGILREFSLKPADASNSLPLRLRLVTQVEVAGRAAARYEHVQDFLLRNGE